MWSLLHLRDRAYLLMVLMIPIFNGSSELASRQMLFNRHFLERGWSPHLPFPCELWGSRGGEENRYSVWGFLI